MMQVLQSFVLQIEKEIRSGKTPKKHYMRLASTRYHYLWV